MANEIVDVRRLVIAGLAAGLWVLVSGLLMAAVFGYREMQAAFDAVGLQVPSGAEPFVIHTLVRLLLGMGVVALFAIFVRVLSPGQSMWAAALFLWVFSAVLPFAVVVQWGLFSWALASKLWAWSAAELLIAAWIGRLLYRP